MNGGQALDVLIVSLGSTEGLRTADQQLLGSIERAGASVAIAQARAPKPTRTLMLTDLAWARAARAAAATALAQFAPRAIIYSSTTASLLGPRAGAIRFDAPSAGNRPGRHGLWQRPLERRRLAQAQLLLALSEGGLNEVPAAARRGERALVLPAPVDPSGGPGQGRDLPARDIAAITYASNPSKKGLDRVLSAWHSVRAREGSPSQTSRDPQELVVAGVSEQDLQRAGYDLTHEPGVRVVGALSHEHYRALVRRARVFICAPRREDYGAAQLEALADGCLLVSTPAPGPYAALAIARELDPRLISEDLAAALQIALEDPARGYALRAREALGPYSSASVDELVATELLPRLLGSALLAGGS